jgi:tetratricopeptide (TPR) repeat protein
MWAQWLSTFPDVRVLPLDLGGGGPEDRRPPAIPQLAGLLLSRDERVLLTALAALATGTDFEAVAVLRSALDQGSLDPDVRFLAAACELGAGNPPAALDLLGELYLHAGGDQRHPAIGETLRHIYPALRCLVRITPTQLLPVYPSPYGAALLYAVALDACGQCEKALQVLREMVPLYGLLDELRIMAARIHVSLNNLDTARTALEHADCSEPDALEFTRSFYLAYCLYCEEHCAKAAQLLGRVVRTMPAVNAHSLARARLLLADCYGRCGLLLDALQTSGAVDPALLPTDAARLVLAREERWLTELGELSAPELERLAGADSYQVFVPEGRPVEGRSRLNTSHDPLASHQPRALSWAQRRREEEDYAAARSALERGEEVPSKFQPQLSSGASALRRSIAAAGTQWPERRRGLASAPGAAEVSQYVMAQARHVRFDFRGNRPPSLRPLQGERRAAQLLGFGGAVLAIAAVLSMLHGCASW